LAIAVRLSSNKSGSRNNSNLPHEKGDGSMKIAARFPHSHSLDDGMKFINPSAYGIRILRARSRESHMPDVKESKIAVLVDQFGPIPHDQP
jgi:hypothetical protein